MLTFLRQVIYANLKDQVSVFRREDWERPFTEQELEDIAEATRTINRIIWGSSVPKNRVK